jgi:predicted TIM-barrel fold metal-dependent hydrolase
MSFDVDLRCGVALSDVASGLSLAWREHLGIGLQGQRAVASNSTTSGGWAGVLPGGMWEPPDPDVPASPRPAGAAGLLEARGLSGAVVNPGIAPRLTGLANPDWSRDLARATNDWLAREWLEREPRLLGTIVVSARDPKLAAEEIRRAAEHPRMAQVAIGYPLQFLGDRLLNPIYAAASELGLTVLVQAGGEYTGRNPGLTGTGDPFHRFETSVSHLHAAQPHLASLVALGTFERFPELRIVFGGFGVAWLASLLWQLDRAYAGSALETPRTLTRRPGETLLEHVRFTTELLETHDPAQLEAVLAPAGGERLLVLGSGGAGLDAAPLLPEAWRAAVGEDNARALYRRALVPAP